MAGLDELASGAYFNPDPYSPEPQYFRGASASDVKAVVPVSFLGERSMGPEQRFRKSTAGRAAYPRFKKGPLGEYETESRLSMLAPSETGLPPEKRFMSLPRAQTIQDMFSSFLHGAGKEAMALGGMPRALMELGVDMLPPGFEKNLPSEEELGKMAARLKRFVPLSEQSMSTLTGGPQTSGGDKMASLGSLAPYGALGAVGAGRALLPHLYRMFPLLP